MKFHVDHRFERCTLERFIAVYFSEHFNTEVAAISGLRTRRLVEEVIEGDGRRRRRVLGTRRPRTWRMRLRNCC
jgi:hypothetical protein